MWNRLLLLWRRFTAWLMPGPAMSHHNPVSKPYQHSNLHARHYH